MIFVDILSALSAEEDPNILCFRGWSLWFRETKTKIWDIFFLTGEPDILPCSLLTTPLSSPWVLGMFEQVHDVRWYSHSKVLWHIHFNKWLNPKSILEAQIQALYIYFKFQCTLIFFFKKYNFTTKLWSLKPNMSWHTKHHI